MEYYAIFFCIRKFLCWFGLSSDAQVDPDIIEFIPLQRDGPGIFSQSTPDVSFYETVEISFPVMKCSEAPPIPIFFDEGDEVSMFK